MTEIVYPSYLRSDAFKNRCFTINILEAPAFADGIEAALDRITEKVKNLGGTAAAAATGGASPKDIIKSLEEIKEKEVETNTIFTIVLPLPNTFTDSVSHGWALDTGLIKSTLGELENKTLGDVPGVGKLLKFIPGAGSVSASKVLGSLSDQAGMRKPLVDPGYFQNYGGTEPREFTFDFDLIAENPEDAANIIKIILKLKEFSSPEMSPGGVSLLAPNFFDLKIANEVISGVANVRGLVLKSMNIDYGADGAMQFLPDGTPKYIKLSLGFAERSMTTANHYRG